MRRFFNPLIVFVCVVFLFFYQFFLSGKLPIPADTIIGLYHPFRDLYAEDYPRGIPYKNFLITDPVRQQFPWRFLSINSLIRYELPLWNPYNAAGTPLLANVQNAALYPLNSIFWIFSFPIAWSVLVIVQTLFAGIFLYFYLRFMKVSYIGSLFGGITFGLCGFSISWLEWNSIGHVILWLPLILLAKEKLLQHISFRWGLILIFAEVSAFFAGHLQTFFYILILSSVYLASRIIQISWTKNNIKLTIRKVLGFSRPFFVTGGIAIFITAILWLPTIQYVLLSARNVDQVDWQKDGWFVPWQHAIQFFAPDFFGNPTTLNYWGTWNYGELVGYVGLAPFIFALFALFFRRDKKTFFFGTVFFLSLIFAFPTFFAKIPYALHIPFLSTAQPTRLLSITDFSLAVLAAMGFDYFIKQKKQIIYPIGFIGLVFILLWSFVLLDGNLSHINSENLAVARRNLVLPTAIFSILVALIGSVLLLAQKARITFMIQIIIVGLTLFELIRFGWKFIPFTDQRYLFPQTKVISFLQKQQGQFRIMATDDRILPPNFSVMYGIQSIDVYDPLYLQRYGELIAASERGEPNISPPFGFNRIISPHRFDSKLIDLLGVKYVLSLSDLDSLKLRKVFQEGETRIYENKYVFQRAFFVEEIIDTGDKKASINTMFSDDINLRKAAIVEDRDINIRNKKWTIGEVEIKSYEPNKVVLQSKNLGDSYLVLSDSFYPTWQVMIDGIPKKIYRTDYHFRGVIIPSGDHTVEFKNKLFIL